MSLTPSPHHFLICTADRCDLGSLAWVLDQFRCEYDAVVRGSFSELGFDPDLYAGLVLLGDSSGHSDDDRIYGREMEWVRTAMAAGRGVLGICHGAQLLAHVLGGTIRYGRAKLDSGLSPITLSEFGVDDPIVRAVRGVPVAQWHFDRFTLPDGAIPLAYSNNRAQPHIDAFRVGNLVYGLQFHPETTAAAIVDEGWCTERPPEHDLHAAEAAGKKLLAAWVAAVLTARTGVVS